jgi:predicted NUDIX family NTP pyrophosphohydrolase
MAVKQSAGILLYRIKHKRLEVFLIHPGGPFWKNKDDGAWSIPKGEYTGDEDPLEAARRELKEETGFDVKGKLIPLTPIRQKGGKQVIAWAIEGDVDANAIKSNLFEMEWPPRSGKMQSFPEADKAAWLPVEEAMKKINPSQAALIIELSEITGKK